MALSGILSIMMEKSAQAGEGGGCTPTPFHYITITYKVVMYASTTERADTLPLFLLYPYMYSVLTTCRIFRYTCKTYIIVQHLCHFRGGGFDDSS
jgi:hypothetical protein